MSLHSRRSFPRSLLTLTTVLALVLSSPIPAATTEAPAGQTEVDATESHHDASGQHDTGQHDTGDHHDTDSQTDHGRPDHAGGSDKITCADIDPEWNQLELKGHPLSGHYAVSDANRSIEFFVYDAPAGGKKVNWSSDGPIDAVILRSGQDAATYEYETPTTSASGLIPPLVDREGRNLAAVLGCYSEQPEAVDIDLYLADSSDPVEVGIPFSYIVEVVVPGTLSEAEVLLTLAPGIVATQADPCAIEDRTVRCSPPLETLEQWSTEIEVTASESGLAVSWIQLTGVGETGPVSVSALEATRVIGERGGHGGGCGGHDDGHEDGHDPGSEHHDEEGCGEDRHGLVAACEAIEPGARTIVLRGPFASRRYQVSEQNGTEIWVQIGETTGAQMASWQSNVPVDAVLARTGRQIEIYANTPPTYEGSGVVGPMSGSGPRPMADLAFCIGDRPAVDMSVSAGHAVSIPLGRSRPLEVTVTNAGHRAAIGVTLRIEPSSHVELRACGRFDAVEGSCTIGPLDPLDTTSLDLRLQGTAVGTGDILVEVAADNEDTARKNDNTVVVAITVETRTPSSSGDSTAADQTSDLSDLPFDAVPVVLSAEAEETAETPGDVGSSTAESEFGSDPEAEPPEAVTADQTTLPFTGGIALGWIAASGLAMVGAGSGLLVVLELLGDRRRGAHIRRRSTP